MADLSLILALIGGFVIGLVLLLIQIRTKTLRELGVLPVFFSILGSVLIVIGTILSSWSYVISGAFLFLCFVPDELIKHTTPKVFRWLSLLAVTILGYLVLSTTLLRVGVLIVGFLVGIAGLVHTFRLTTGKIIATSVSEPQ